MLVQSHEKHFSRLMTQWRQYNNEKEWWEHRKTASKALRRIEEYFFLYPDYLANYKALKREAHQYLQHASSGPEIVVSRSLTSVVQG